MELKGIIIEKLPVRTGVSQRTGNTWAMQEIVVETEDQYPQKACFTVFGQDRIDNVKAEQGEVVTVKFDLRASEYNGRWYNKLDAYSIVSNETAPAAEAQAPQQAVQTQPQPTQQPVPAQEQQAEDSGLPF